MTVIHFRPYFDCRREPKPTRWQRLMAWIFPPKKAPVFKIRNPRKARMAT